jgi:hypothetical protein
MPDQLNGQLVVKNSTTPAQAVGAGGAAGFGGAFVTIVLSADAVDAHARAPNPNIMAVQTLDFFILPPLSQPTYQQTSLVWIYCNDCYTNILANVIECQ